MVVVAFVNTTLVAEKILEVLVRVKSPPIPTFPVMFALVANKFASVVEPAVRVTIFAFPKYALAEYEFVEDDVVEKKVVVVAALPIALTNVVSPELSTEKSESVELEISNNNDDVSLSFAPTASFAEDVVEPTATLPPIERLPENVEVPV